MKVVPLTEQGIDTFINSHDKVVIKASVENCQKCIEYVGVFDAVARNYKDVAFGAITIKTPSKFRDKWLQTPNSAPPTTLIFQKGALLVSKDGLMDPDSLIHLIEKGEMPITEVKDEELLVLYTDKSKVMQKISNRQKQISEISTKLQADPTNDSNHAKRGLLITELEMLNEELKQINTKIADKLIQQGANNE